MTKEKLKNNGLAYRDYLYYACYSRVALNEDNANNCVQNTYLAFFEALEKENYQIHKCRGWLYKVLRVNIKEFFRAEKEQKEYEIDFDFVIKAEEEGTTYYNSIPEEKIEKIEKHKNIFEKIKQLKRKELALLIDIYYNNKKLSQIAVEQEKSENCIKKRHERLKRKLTKIYKEIETIEEKGELQ